MPVPPSADVEVPRHPPSAAPPAVPDAAFVAAMQADGIQAVGNDWPALIYNGHRICWAFAHGISRPEIAAAVKSVTDLPDVGVNDFVGLSIAYYCPQYSGA
jgi:hypothetical protein